MHISEGVLSAPVLISGGVLAVVGTAVGLKKIDYDHVARVGILAATFFVASLVHVPIGPSSVHLIMNGLVGLLLGWAAVPAIMVALLLQAVFFQFGGITTLGVNTVIMALPAVLCFYLFGPLIHKDRKVFLVAGFATGSVAALFSAITMGFALMFTEEGFFAVAALAVSANLPIIIIEGIVTAFCVGFLKKVKPDMLP